MNILDKIVAYKKEEVALQKAAVPEVQLQQHKLFERPTLSLQQFLTDENRTGIIAEFKRRSPSKGVINGAADVAAVTQAYTDGGASGLSVLTDGPSFGGSAADLIDARVNHIPILRKEFIIDPYQIIEAKAIGADVILLIAAILTPQQVASYTKLAHSLGLQVILEVHDEEELGHVSDEVDVVGVNNRNLKTFEVSLQQSVQLGVKLSKQLLKISESGIHSVADIVFLKEHGYNGFLIGENFMKQSDPAIAFKRFAAELKEIKV